jgi:hypothetical protein
MRSYRPIAFALVCIASLVFLAAAQAFAQKPVDRPPIDLTPDSVREEATPSKGDPFSGSLFGYWGVPVGAFHHNEDGGLGLGFHGAYALDQARHVAMRLEAGFLMYGYIRRDIDLPAYDEFGGFTGYENVSYAARQHEMYNLDFGPEITALSGTVRPYGFATAGFSYFVSRINVRPPQYAGDDPIDHTLFSAGNFAWSTGVGLRIGSEDPRGGSFDVGIRFRRNARARYANDRALSTQSDGSITVSPFYGSANLLSIYAGFWVGPKLRRQ